MDSEIRREPCGSSACSYGVFPRQTHRQVEPQRVDCRARKLWTLTSQIVGLALLAIVSGCGRRAPLEFSPSSAVRGLPETHQRQIEANLGRLFGSPVAPWIRGLGEDSSAESDESSNDGAEESGDEETNAGETEQTLVDLADRGRLLHGAKVYNVRCAGCHGVTGDGLGPAAAYLQPKPRDYRRGIYKFTSTPYGYKPSRNDLVRTIRRGAKGTSMPSFPWMPEEDIEGVIDYVVFLSQRGEVEHRVADIVSTDYEAEDAIEQAEFTDALTDVRTTWLEAEAHVVRPITPEPPMNAASIAKGRELFISASCFNCHGKDLKGQSEWLSHEFIAAQESVAPEKRVQINRDAWGDAAPAADITARVLHGGRRPIDVYRRIYKGINGTPMPAFNQLFADAPDNAWHLVHYVLSVVEGGPVEPASAAEVAP